MATIVVGSYMVRYPLAGMMSWVQQYLVGLAQLGHDVVLVEKSAWHGSCFDPVSRTSGDDCATGVEAVGELLGRSDPPISWCYVDSEGGYHGLSRPEVEERFRRAAAFFEMGSHGAWDEEASRADLRVLLDGDPLFTQVGMLSGSVPAGYDAYVTVGAAVGSPGCGVPTAGVDWIHAFHPVVTSLFDVSPPCPRAPMTTVMNWRSYPPVVFEGVEFGGKDVEFEHFLHLPAVAAVPLEVAVAGDAVPTGRLERAGWTVRSAIDVTLDMASFQDYLRGSLGEFSVAKHGYVAPRSGWFSDRSAAYLASGRPVVLQDTGFGAHLPVGCGLHAVSSVDEAADAIDRIAAHPAEESAAARALAEEHLEAGHVLGRLLDVLDIR